MKLYRGDNIFNATEPGRYRFDGIRSKSFGKGFPNYIDALNLKDNIRKHVNPVSVQDWDFYNKTEYISFTTSKQRALFWLSSKETLALEIAKTDYKETRYLFLLEIDEEDIRPMDDGKTIFLYQFSCNPDLKTLNSDNKREQAVYLSTAPNTYFKSCPICEKKYKKHALLLIDTSKYLQTYKDSSKYDGAIANAQHDQEWLILPNDTLTGFSGTTLPRADFWSTEHYNAKGEDRPVDMHSIQGQIFDETGSAI